MNDEVLTPEDQRLLDRLVDDELTDAERRELLLRFERTADGWRRCGLAFLEAQTWRGEAKALVAEPAPSPAIVPASIAHRNRLWQYFAVPLAAAAGFLTALVGYQLVTSSSGGPRAPIVASSGSNVTGTPVVAGGRASKPAESLRLVVNGGERGGPEVVEVPLVDPSRMNEALFGAWSQTLPDELVRQLEQSGRQVVRQRQLVPVNLQDGRRVVVPVDQVEIRPVGLQQFQ